jgi:hypothetical protein
MSYWIIEIDVFDQKRELDAVLDCQVEVANSQNRFVDALDSPVAHTMHWAGAD